MGRRGLYAYRSGGTGRRGGRMGRAHGRANPPDAYGHMFQLGQGRGQGRCDFDSCHLCADVRTARRRAAATPSNPRERPTVDR